MRDAVLRLRDIEMPIIVDEIKLGGLGSELVVEEINDSKR